MHSGAYREIFYTAEVSRQPENVSENGHTGKFDSMRRRFTIKSVFLISKNRIFDIKKSNF